MQYDRNIKDSLLKSFHNNPVVLLNGARQVGKSTLIEKIVQNNVNAEYLSLDDHAILFSSSKDPYGFLESYTKPLAIDEIQRNTDLLLAIKRLVDQRKSSGQFFLTGSANVLTMPKISESLAGRMVCHTLWPLSQGELHGRKENFISKVFNNKKLSAQNLPPLSQEDIMDIIIKGGYPRSLLSVDSKDRLEWMNSYLDSILQRDIRQLSNIEGLKDLPHLLALLSERAGNLLNVADISRIIGIQQMTLKRYYTLLQMVFLIIEVPAWFTNREKRLAKAPKVYINDTGLGCCLKRIDKEVLFKHRQVLGPLLENFVVMELIKQSSWSDIAPKLYHFRTQAGHEVDIVLEGTNRDIVGIEVKASTSIGENDLKGLKKLQELAQDKFINGIIIYTGSHFLSLGNNLYALPLQYLWGI